jgi:threonyl-tRNA synthetase
MIRLTFPDNSSREFAPGITGREVAEGISKSLAKKAVAMALDGELADLADPIARDATIERRRCRSFIQGRRSPSVR